jgi:phenylalanyl-tRNA synthetase beta chain
VLVPLSWLGDFVPLDAYFGAGAPIRPGEGLRRLTDTLDSLGLVVERVEAIGEGLEGVVVAKVLEIAPIKGADRIRRVLVDAGGEAVEVVCGAWNFEVGDLVPLAKVGATLPGGMHIERRTMRGVTSSGMLCSGAELHLADDEAGILILERPGSPHAGYLAKRAEPGTPLAEHLEIELDVVLDLAIEANRPDCLSLVGIARDLAAKAKLPFFPPEPQVQASGPAVGELAAIALYATDACERLVARVLTGLSTFSSPPRVQRRLLLAGMRPISAVVDASNYVMLELGQPTHAYDLDRLGGGGVAVRRAQPGETLVTLDGALRILGTEALPGEGRDGQGEGECVIVDLADQVVGLAGIMGGATTEVGEATQRILLEAAAFVPAAISQAARRQGMRTEASVRFERGIDPEGLPRALDRVAELVVEAAAVAGVPSPLVAPGMLDERAHPPRARRILLRTERLNRLLGTTLDAEEAAGYLAPIGFQAVPAPSGLEVEVPSFRPDVTLEVDLIEEVARHHGYDRIVGTDRRSPWVGRLSPSQATRRALRRLLTGAGVDEAWTSSIVDPRVARRLGAAASAVSLANPMVAEESALRTHLLPGLLEALRRNIGHRNEHVRLFELGAVFAATRTSASAGAARTGLVEEREHLGVLLAGEGDEAGTAVACLWRLVEGVRLDEAALVLDQDLSAGLGRQHNLEPGDGTLVGDLLAGCHPTRSARVVLVGEGGVHVPLGAVGEVDPALLDEFAISASRRVGWLVLDVAQLDEVPRRSLIARPVSRFPSSDVDLAFVLDAAVPAARLVEVVREAAGELCEWVRVIDVYRGEHIAQSARSVTVRVRLGALDRTLSEGDVKAVREAAVALANERLGAQLRS